MASAFEPPPVLETLITRLGELAVVVGPAAAPRLGAVREALTRALGLKAAGDIPAAMQAIAAAMRELAAVAAALDPAEAALMRAAAEQFGAAMRRGESGEMRRASEVMRERSGARPAAKK
ncbi:MAG: hypothetical protein B6D46_03035 [Polyangiaceae bacterium UTPRO1]|jgi:hypothetical protein|nr:hypothetical protein [Myxococcales bacterium]OQY68636.1 MAG: hypothetical protein B6D46_03035 [Polyangiaceae bacterium UTPRO1]